MWKFKSWKGKDKCLFLLTIGVMLCILAFPAEGLAEKGGAGGSGAGKVGDRGGGGDFGIEMSEDRSREGVGLTGGIGGLTGGIGGLTGEGRTLAGEGGTLAGGSGASVAEASATPAGTYEAVLEKRVREILKHVEGVGTVDVMIVLKSSAEKVIHVDGSSSLASTEEKDSSGGTRRIESQEQENSAVLLAGEGQNAPIIEKELYPEISGIVISATGGGDPKIQAEISAAMEALFDVPAHKIKVLKRVE